MSEDDTFKSFRYPPLSTALATNHIPNLERAVAFKSDFRLKPPSPPPLEELESESVTVIYEIKRILPVQQPVPKKIEEVDLGIKISLLPSLAGIKEHYHRIACTEK
ncbi:uncharacterized protein LOC121379042 isoform X3 [Gigantopelta aegis]|uniref:uncharacterized protein LOC121379042 isoform X3 n=1 Tax=Gigantopelta aegis TaxID=1735272 RepID=UPI001B88DDD2|nr:uncharacterized protein LOC121379042 isoform X3 [Gigantopelta aegis]